jgi:hypothetical protein
MIADGPAVLPEPAGMCVNCRFRGVTVKKLILLVVVLCCSGCSLLTPYAEWPNGNPMYPGAYKIATDNLKNPNYHPSTVEMLQRKMACSGPAPSGICNNNS